MTEQLHHKSDQETSRGTREVGTQSAELPLSNLFVLRNARDGNPAYMDGGWAVDGHTRDEQGNLISTQVTKIVGDPDNPRRVFKKIPTSELYEAHFAEVKRQATERQAALGEGALEAVLVEQDLEQAQVEPKDLATEKVAAPEEDSEELEAIARELNERAAALEASLAINERQRTKLRSDAGRVMQVMRLNVVDQLKRNIAVSPYVITEVKEQLKVLLVEIETDRTSSTEEVNLSSVSPELESAAKANAGSRKRELASFARRLQSNRHNRELATSSAYHSCEALVRGMLDQLQSGRFDSQLMTTLEVAVGKIEQGIGGSNTFDYDLKRLLKDVQTTLEDPSA